MPSRIGLRELRAAAKEGECPFCGEPNKPGFKFCGDDICQRAYRRYDRRDRRQSARRRVVGRRYRPSRSAIDKLVLYAEELECGHVRPYSLTGDKPSDVRLCRTCLTTRTEQLR